MILLLKAYDGDTNIYNAPSGPEEEGVADEVVPPMPPSLGVKQYFFCILKKGPLASIANFGKLSNIHSFGSYNDGKIYIYISSLLSN